MLVNGLPQQHVSLNDRALNYGDGVFETIRLYQGRTVLFAQHMQRLQNACHVLGIACDFETLSTEISSLQQHFPDYGILKILVSRGAGGRGYRPEDRMTPTRMLSLHALPPLPVMDGDGGVGVFMCEHRLTDQGSLAGLKHLNRLDQVMASREWPDAKCFEGLMRDKHDNVIAGTRSNLFYAQNGRLFTPSLSDCGVAGILRAYLMEMFGEDLRESTALDLDTLLQVDELFLCNSVTGVWPVSSLQITNTKKYFKPGQFCRRAQKVFAGILEANAVD